MSHSPLIVRPLAGARLALLLAVTACASTSQSNDASDGAPERPIGPIVEATNSPDAIGTLLAKLDASIRAWTTLMMTAETADERRKASLLEQNLMFLTHNRVDELVEQLETGPLYNQIVAAAALGFTRDPQAHSPLIAALENPNSDVVSNALLGIALLGRIDTPLERVCTLLRTSPDAWVRSNAAQCLSSLVRNGAQSECVLATARAGLADEEPVVRSQCALILANQLDTESIPSLEALLQDRVTLVGAASARAIAHIGAQSPAHKGAAGRALTAAFSRTSDALRPHLLQSLIDLAGGSYGEAPEEWSAWSRDLP
jgi:HEAT repeats